MTSQSAGRPWKGTPEVTDRRQPSERLGCQSCRVCVQSETSVWNWVRNYKNEWIKEQRGQSRSGTAYHHSQRPTAGLCFSCPSVLDSSVVRLLGPQIGYALPQGYNKGPTELWIVAGFLPPGTSRGKESPPGRGNSSSSAGGCGLSFTQWCREECV